MIQIYRIAKHENMNLNTVLENWSDYDNRKMKVGDERFFACTESWEVDYLDAKIKVIFPFLGILAIKEAIQHCCESTQTPRPRGAFVRCVLERLAVIKV